MEVPPVGAELFHATNGWADGHMTKLIAFFVILQTRQKIIIKNFKVKEVFCDVTTCQLGGSF